MWSSFFFFFLLSIILPERKTYVFASGLTRVNDNYDHYKTNAVVREKEGGDLRVAAVQSSPGGSERNTTQSHCTMFRIITFCLPCNWRGTKCKQHVVLSIVRRNYDPHASAPIFPPSRQGRSSIAAGTRSAGHGGPAWSAGAHLTVTNRRKCGYVLRACLCGHTVYAHTNRRQKSSLNYRKRLTSG